MLSTVSWEVLKGVWAVNDKPMPPSGIAFAFYHSLAVVPFDKWFESLFDKDIKAKVKAGSIVKIGMEGNFDTEMVLASNPQVIQFL